MTTAFVCALALLAVTYVGYPALALALARLRPRPLRLAPGGAASSGPPVAERSVSVVIAARDEAAVIVAKIESVLGCGHPLDRLEVIVVDDGSRDGTAEAAATVAPGLVRVVRLGAPSGKAVAQNAGVAEAKNEILVLTDARQPLEPGAISHLLAPFADEEVGAVSGELSLRAGGGGLGFYRKLDDAMRRAEAASGSSVGVTGALWAMRRALYTEVPAGLILDDLFQPLSVARQGRRVVIAPAARAIDSASPDPSRELRRRTRTLAGNFQLVRACPWLLSSTANPLFLRLLGHKLLRLVAPLALAVLLCSNLSLALQASAFGSGGRLLVSLALAAQLLVYGLAAAAPGEGEGASRVGGPLGLALRVSRAFVMLHVAVVLGAVRFLRGDEAALWRDAAPPAASRAPVVEGSHA